MRTMIAVLCSVVLFGCAEHRKKMEPLPVADQARIPDNRGYVDAQGNLVAGPPLPGLRFAKSEGTCAPPESRSAFTACCGQQPCNGHCVTNDDGTTGCSCFGVAGGCPPGYACSKEHLTCVKVDKVQPTSR